MVGRKVKCEGRLFRENTLIKGLLYDTFKPLLS